MNLTTEEGTDVAGMTSRAWRSWATRSIAPVLDRPAHWEAEETAWEATNFGLMGSPSGWLAQGVMRWPARSVPSFEAFAMVMPLYRPTDIVYRNWSASLTSESGGRAFDNPTPDTKAPVADDLVRSINKVGVPFLEDVGVLEGFRDRVQQIQGSVLSERGVFAYAEEVGYTEILLGNIDSADHQLARYSETAGEADDAEWLLEQRRRCGHILKLLRRDPALARAELARWADQSAIALGLTRQAAPLDVIE